jgi:hypothetical protein
MIDRAQFTISVSTEKAFGHYKSSLGKRRGKLSEEESPAFFKNVFTDFDPRKF